LEKNQRGTKEAKSPDSNTDLKFTRGTKGGSDHSPRVSHGKRGGGLFGLMTGGERPLKKKKRKGKMNRLRSPVWPPVDQKPMFVRGCGWKD